MPDRDIMWTNMTVIRCASDRGGRTIKIGLTWLETCYTSSPWLKGDGISDIHATAPTCSMELTRNTEISVKSSYRGINKPLAMKSLRSAESVDLSPSLASLYASLAHWQFRPSIHVPSQHNRLVAHRAPSKRLWS